MVFAAPVTPDLQHRKKLLPLLTLYTLFKPLTLRVNTPHYLPKQLLVLPLATPPLLSRIYLPGSLVPVTASGSGGRIHQDLIKMVQPVIK